MMMSYMHSQRAKYLKGPVPKKMLEKQSIPVPATKSPKVVAPVSGKSTAVAAFVSKASTPPAGPPATLMVDPLEGTPSRSTRSRSKAL